MIEIKKNLDKVQRAILVGVVHKSVSEKIVMEYLDELAFLAETAGAICIEKFYQKLEHPLNATYIGSGKLEELKVYCKVHEIDLVIFDDELSPKQLQNIEKEIEVMVLDRTNLILDIFATRAQSAQARTQVELAQYQYLLPRLRGMWTHLERQGGGIGTRGPGETEIETDRRIIQNKISRLKQKLKEIDKQNFTQRKNRGEYIRVSLVGYTNVGKSTLMNLISKSEVLAENKLFATLDTTTRKVFLNQTPFLLSDTVGFIRKLPHHLVESFKSTLDEVREADLILHVVDMAHENYEEHIQIVEQTLQELNVTNIKTILVFNKLDSYIKNSFDEWLEEDVKESILKQFEMRWQNEDENCILVSAESLENIEQLKELITDKVKELYYVRFPYRSNYF